MKKLFSRLLPAVLGMMVLSASTAFAQVNPDAKAVYDDMEAKSNLISDANIYYHINMIMASGGESMNMAMDMNMLINNMNQPDKMQYLNQSIVTVGEIQETTTSWYKDGYSYAETGGKKIKFKSDMDTLMTSALSMNATLGSSSDLLTELSLSTEGDVRILSYTMDGSKLNAYMEQALGAMGMDKLLTTYGIEMKIHDVKGTYTLSPDNNFTSATIFMGMDITAEGETISVAVAGDIVMLNPGQPVQLMLPDPAGYVEMSAGQNAA